ncbi:MAG: type I restriction enzyme HsdR N-terminal domain-containing protein [Flavitalea sp.]
MIQINYPEPDFRIREENNISLIFDELRKTWLVLTPEEWVRQNFVRYLTKIKQYPATLIAIEKQLKLGELIKRFDLLIYDSNHQPWMMVEFKAMEVRLDQKVLEQILRYNMSVPVKYLIITNGVHCIGIKREGGTPEWLEELPEFEK